MKRTHVGLAMSVRLIQIQNGWTDLDEIWYGRYAFGVYPKIVLFIF
jgi:hypothetical protein